MFVVQNDTREIHNFIETRCHMLPNVFSIGQAFVRKDGIHFNGCLYSCQLAIKEQWFRDANTVEEWYISVYFDPNKLDFILLLVEGKGIVPAYLLNPNTELDPAKLDAYYAVFNYLKDRVRRRAKRQRKQVEKHV